MTKRDRLELRGILIVSGFCVALAAMLVERFAA